MPVRPMREMCKVCGDVVTVGFHVPDEIWAEVVHPRYINDIHCLRCFTRRADEKLVHWEKGIRFFPVSFAQHIDQEFFRQEMKSENPK